jgi:hypothetical protein
MRMMNRYDKVLLGVMARLPSPELDVAALCAIGDGRATDIAPMGRSDRASMLAFASVVILWVATVLLSTLGGR